MPDIYEKDLDSKTTLETSDYVRIVGDDNVSYKNRVADIAETVITDYDSQTLAGSQRTVKEAIDFLQNKTNNIYSPHIAHTASEMTNQDLIYIYVGSETGYTNGNWYYYDGGTWVSGGVYNAIAVNTDTTLSIAGRAADAKATGDAVDGLDDDITDLKSALSYMFDGLDDKFIVFDNNDTTYGSGSVWGERATANGIVSNNNFACYTFTAQKDGELYCVQQASVGFEIYIYSGTPSSETYIDSYSSVFPTESDPLEISAGQVVAINKNSSGSVTWIMAFSGFDVNHVTPTTDLLNLIKEDFYKVTPTWIPDYFVSAADGQIAAFDPTSDTKYWINNYTYCHNCSSIKFVASYAGSSVGYCFLDYTKKPILSGQNSGSRYDTLTVAVPDNAYYFVTTARTTPNETYTADLWLIYSQQSLGKELIASNNPILSGNKDAGYTALFRKIGLIGDSLMSGASFYEEGGEYYGGDTYDYSWGSFLCRDIDAEAHHFSEGGLTVRTWWTHFYNTEAFTSNLCQAYYIGLGVNDRKTSGTTVPLGTSSDINLSDFMLNADTYYGGYAKIIQYIKSLVPKAKIFVITNPKNEDGYNTAVRYMAETFDNVYLIDMWTYGSGLYTNAYLGSLWLNGHLTAPGYRKTAYEIGAYTDWIIRNNIGNFNDVIGILDN